MSTKEHSLTLFVQGSSGLAEQGLLQGRGDSMGDVGTKIGKPASSGLGSAGSENEAEWLSARERLEMAVSDSHRGAIQRLLSNVHNGGAGLRDWISSVAYRGSQLPDRIPDAIVDVYVADPEAAPLHDCEKCGVAIPVRPNRVYGMESGPEEQYFPACPVCGGRTGPYSYWSCQADAGNSNAVLRRRKPR